MDKNEILSAIDCYNKVCGKAHDIIASTSDEYISHINRIYVEDDELCVHYDWTCRGCTDFDFCYIPFEWLADGFDYVTAFKENQKRLAEERKKQAAIDAEKEEREEYERLKKKFEN